jgi:hypothetical protein
LRRLGRRKYSSPEIVQRIESAAFQAGHQVVRDPL